MTRILADALDEPLPRNPARKSARGMQKFQTSVSLPREIGLALREVARSGKRSMSDVVTESCAYWLDINVPDWRETIAAMENRDGR